MTATVIYRCKQCRQTRRIRYRRELQHIGYGRKVAVYFKESDGSRGPGGEYCCGRRMTFGFLQARLNPAVKCNARCTHAVGFSCECSCGGENHATGGVSRAGLFTGLLPADGPAQAQGAGAAA